MRRHVCWHKADVPLASTNVRCGDSGHVRETPPLPIFILTGHQPVKFAMMQNTSTTW